MLNMPQILQQIANFPVKQGHVKGYLDVKGEQEQRRKYLASKMFEKLEAHSIVCVCV